MRFKVLASLTCAALSLMTVSAHAAWKAYISHPLGFAFTAPGVVKIEKGTYRAAIAGLRNTLVFRSVDDNIEYKVTVIDFTADPTEAANLLGEATINFKQGKKVLIDTYGRCDNNYGRKIAADLPNNGGRTVAAIYFLDGRIVEFQATVLPANGDDDTPDTARFVDSPVFSFIHVVPDAVELKLPK